MPSLTERLSEVMQHMRWNHADLVRVSGQSSSVVSQWLGKGSKEIKTIGKLEAALYIERASGYSALWISKGIGPKIAHRSGPVVANEPPPAWRSPRSTLDDLQQLLQTLHPDSREVVADLLAGWARNGGADDRKAHLALALDLSSKREAAA